VILSAAPPPRFSLLQIHALMRNICNVHRMVAGSTAKKLQRPCREAWALEL
jgi:hypothetical protein